MIRSHLEYAVSVWNPHHQNKLPDHVVLSETVNTFKSRLDKFWQHQRLESRWTVSRSISQS